MTFLFFPNHQKASVPAKKVQAPAPTADSNEEEDEDSVDNLISNDVLEWETQNIKTKIAQLQATKKPVPEELSDRLQAVQLKSSMLTVQVETGQLQPEVYFQQLQVRCYLLNGNDEISGKDSTRKSTCKETIGCWEARFGCKGFEESATH